MSEIDTRGISQLSGMFGGEKVVFGKEMMGVFSGEDARETEKNLKELPNEIVVFFRALANDFPRFTEELLADLLLSLQEKEARRRLWERFGRPRSPLAVPVFKQLAGDLDRAQDDVSERIAGVDEFVHEMGRLIAAISLHFSVETNALRQEEADYDVAIHELETMDVRGETIESVVDPTIQDFQAERKEKEEKRKKAEENEIDWLNYAKRWEARLAMVETFETPIDIAAPNPVMAL